MKKSKIRIGILGFGSRGVSLVQPLLDSGTDVEIKWIIDTDIQKSKYFFETHFFNPENENNKYCHPKVNFVKSLSEVRKNEIEALLLTASEKVRTELFGEALLFDIPIFMEKALSNSLEGSNKILTAFRTKPDAKVFMGFNLRYNPLTEEVKKIIKRGDIGRPLFIHYLEKLREFHGASFYRRFAGNLEQEQGGLFITKSCHDFDLVNYLIEDRPERIFASCRKVLFGLGGENARNSCSECDRTFECELAPEKFIRSREGLKKHDDFYSGKVTPNFTNSTCVYKKSSLTDMNNLIAEYRSGLRLNYAQILFAAKPGREIGIFGTHGSLQYNLNDKELKVNTRWNDAEYNIKANNIDGNHGGADPRIMKAFINMVRSGGESPSRIEDGAWALVMGCAGYRSSASETWVDVNKMAKEAGIKEK